MSRMSSCICDFGGYSRASHSVALNQLPEHGTSLIGLGVSCHVCHPKARAGARSSVSESPTISVSSGLIPRRPRRVGGWEKKGGAGLRNPCGNPQKQGGGVKIERAPAAPAACSV